MNIWFLTSTKNNLYKFKVIKEKLDQGVLISNQVEVWNLIWKCLGTHCLEESKLLPNQLTFFLRAMAPNIYKLTNSFTSMDSLMDNKICCQRLICYHWMIKQNHNVTAVYIICTKVAENCIISNETTVYL